MFKEIIVVEGHHDEQKLKSIYPDISCIVTGGSAISEDTLSLIEQASLRRGVILMLDPDYPGQQITQKILQIPSLHNVKIAALKRSQAFSKNGRKIGVEHASKEDIVSCLESVVSFEKDSISTVTMNDLYDLGLTGHISSKERRIMLCNHLHLPYANGKTLLKYIHMIGLSKKELDDIR